MNRKGTLFLPAIMFSMAIMFGTIDAETQFVVDLEYDAFEPKAKAFFTSQLPVDLFVAFSNCGIKFNIIPCQASKIVNGKLTCANGEAECDLHRMYACATHLNEGNTQTIGKFVINMFNAGNNLGAAQSCAAKSGMTNWDAIEKCSKSPEADKYCQEYHDQAKGDGGGGSGTPGANSNFKETVCTALKNANESCPVCANCPGGSGNGGGTSGGGAHGGGVPGSSSGGGANGSGTGGGAHGGGNSNGGGASGGWPHGGGGGVNGGGGQGGGGSFGH